MKIQRHFIFARGLVKCGESELQTLQRIFQRFLKKDFVGAFCGQTTLPLDIDGKQLVTFGLDRNNRDIVGPLLAAILHMVVNRNVSRTVPRQDPLVVALDELPTLYLLGQLAQRKQRRRILWHLGLSKC